MDLSRFTTEEVSNQYWVIFSVLIPIYIYLGLNLKVLVVDVKSSNIADSSNMRAEQGWTVRELKQAISVVIQDNYK